MTNCATQHKHRKVLISVGDPPCMGLPLEMLTEGAADLDKDYLHQLSHAQQDAWHSVQAACKNIIEVYREESTYTGRRAILSLRDALAEAVEEISVDNRAFRYNEHRNQLELAVSRARRYGLVSCSTIWIRRAPDYQCAIHLFS